MRRLLNPDLLNHDLAKENDKSIIKRKKERKSRQKNKPPGRLV